MIDYDSTYSTMFFFACRSSNEISRFLGEVASETIVFVGNEATFTLLRVMGLELTSILTTLNGS